MLSNQQSDWVQGFDSWVSNNSWATSSPVLSINSDVDWSQGHIAAATQSQPQQHAKIANNNNASIHAMSQPAMFGSVPSLRTPSNPLKQHQQQHVVYPHKTALATKSAQLPKGALTANSKFLASGDAASYQAAFPPSFSPESFSLLSSPPPQGSADVTNAWKQYVISSGDFQTNGSASTPAASVGQVSASGASNVAASPSFPLSWPSPGPSSSSPSIPTASVKSSNGTPVVPLSASANAANQQQQQAKGVAGRSKQRNLDIESELSKQNLYKTELCRSWMETGTCPYGPKCQFAHGRDELRPVKRHPKYKTEICRTFHTTGTCRYGKRCRFVHDPSERGHVAAISQDEADALELDIQRQLAALKLSLDPVYEQPNKDVIPTEEDQPQYDEDDDEDDKKEEVESESETEKPRKKARLPFFQKLLSKKH